MSGPSLTTAVATIIATTVGYLIGHSDGATFGRERERTEQAMRKSEHDRVMQYVGACKWAKIMAEDIRCRGELP